MVMFVGEAAAALASSEGDETGQATEFCATDFTQKPGEGARETLVVVADMTEWERRRSGRERRRG